MFVLVDMSFGWRGKKLTTQSSEMHRYSELLLAPQMERRGRFNQDRRKKNSQNRRKGFPASQFILFHFLLDKCRAEINEKTTRNFIFFLHLSSMSFRSTIHQCQRQFRLLKSNFSMECFSVFVTNCRSTRVNRFRSCWRRISSFVHSRLFCVMIFSGNFQDCRWFRWLRILQHFSRRGRNV